ncbi:MAG: glycosyltransferase [Candidatus Diapherotrites archaeon]
MNKKFTIGIPAHNEEESIERTLNSLLKSKVPAGYEREIIVCAHNCHDKTAEIVKQIAKKDKEVKLIELRTTGKKEGRFNPLNEIRRVSNSEIIIFCDADVIVDSRAIGRLVLDFEKMPHILAASGVSRPTESRIFIKQKDPANIITSLRKKQIREPALHGRLYGIRTKLVPIFPPLMLDDLFMSAWVGKNRMHIDPDVKVYSRSPQTVEDYYKRQVLMYIAEQEILENAERYAKEYRGTKSASLDDFIKYVEGVAKSYEFDPKKVHKPLTQEETSFVEVYKMLRETAKMHSQWERDPQWVKTHSAKLKKINPSHRK